MYEVKFQLMGDGKMPTRGTDGSAGWDLYSPGMFIILPGQSRLIPLDIKSSFPKCLVGMIRDRSGLAFKKRLTTRAGVIDSDYRDNWGVVLVNESDVQIQIQAGDRVAQVLFLELPMIFPTVVDNVDLTSREGGFGSTGN